MFILGFFFCEDGAKWGHKEVVFCCIYDYQEKLRKNMNSMYINIKKSANVITNSKINDGKCLEKYFTGKPEHFKLYLD